MMNCLPQFLILGTKASKWCRNHLQMTLTPANQSQDEQHSALFYQLVLDCLNFLASIISTMIKYPTSRTVDMLMTENFIIEILNLTKALVLEIKRITSIASEVLKVGQVALDATIKFCRAYYQAFTCNSSGMNGGNEEELIPDRSKNNANHVISITICTITNLYELGTFAASGGGSLVTILNTSWKGVVCLLQLGKGVFSEKVNVGDIIVTLISLAIDSLRCAAESWSELRMESPALSEAKRTFLPIKFYLINAVRISSEYPCDAVDISKEVVKCVIIISSLSIFLSGEIHLKAVSEAMTELLEPTSLLLLHTLLNSADVNCDSKFQILELLLPYDTESCTSAMQKNIHIASMPASLEGIFDVNYDALGGAKSLLLGKVYLFLNLLKASSSFSEEIILQIARKLDVLLGSFTNASVFSSILGLKIPVFGTLGPNAGVVRQIMFSFIVDSLKTFMIVAASSSSALTELEIILMQNLFHPHFLCTEIAMQLLSFLICHAENDMVDHIFEKLCLLLKSIASSQPSLSPQSSLRKMARSICDLISYAKPTYEDHLYSKLVDYVYTTIVSEDKFDLSSVMYVGLLMEGFPLNSLSANLKIQVTGKITTVFVNFIESNAKELGLDASSGSCNSSLLALPVLALSSALNFCQIRSSDVIIGNIFPELTKFTSAVIHGFRGARDDDTKKQFAKLLAALMDILSNTRQHYSSDKIGEIILELQSLFSEHDANLSQCKPHLTTFITGFSQMQIVEEEENPLSVAIWGMFHLLLRERHWALVHLVLSAFGYFAARTSCTQLWRFVPPDAALSFDSATGNSANEDNFMNELRRYLEKEGALCDASPCKHQLSYLIKEGINLRTLTKTRDIASGDKCMKKKRKLPDGICEGMELLQNGLKAMKNALSQDESADIEEEFSTHISQLNDAISRLVGLSQTLKKSNF
ncbi:hypothetical protein AXF42_Ash007992 [Apostasia shenzhenica]|uniref:Uncharacterized protein n=1 Tax=Apostasia shenzhenica TaxID=1088818 RepID=A0A2I0A872_9ASPA|nr:hypothetical protein AXF42_Ash007992 [Apostasia shenzhenica]